MTGRRINGTIVQRLSVDEPKPAAVAAPGDTGYYAGRQVPTIDDGRESDMALPHGKAWTDSRCCFFTVSTGLL